MSWWTIPLFTWKTGSCQCGWQSCVTTDCLVINIIIKIDNIQWIFLKHSLKISKISHWFKWKQNDFVLMWVKFKNTWISLLLYFVWWHGNPQTWSKRNFLVAEAFLGVGVMTLNNSPELNYLIIASLLILCYSTGVSQEYLIISTQL